MGKLIFSPLFVDRSTSSSLVEPTPNSRNVRLTEFNVTDCNLYFYVKILTIIIITIIMIIILMLLIQLRISS